MQYLAPAPRRSPLQAPAHQRLLAVECTHVAGGCKTERFWAQGVLNLGQSGVRCGASTAMREGLQRPLPPLAPPDKGGERRQTAWPCPRAGGTRGRTKTGSPSADTHDERVHFTPANMVSEFHRSIETPFTGRVLKRIFNDDRYFAHHAAILDSLYVSGEGSANHLRLCGSYGELGLEVFVYGREAPNPEGGYPPTCAARPT